MLATLPQLERYDFPAITRGHLTTLQVNLGYRCNQQCLHCHVNAGPARKESMDIDVIEAVIGFIRSANIKTVDLTGGAPELNPHFRYLVRTARDMGIEVIDRCNLTILAEPGQEDLADFLASHQVQIAASLPCYLQENVDGQRGKGVFEASITGLKKLNQLGYGKPDSGLVLNLVYNPTGPYLPPQQHGLELDYKRELGTRYGIVFNQLLTITNMPIQRFGSTLLSKKQFDEYMTLLQQNHREENLNAVMCRGLLSIDWQGFVYDCDFNQMLALPAGIGRGRKVHISEVSQATLPGAPIAVRDHCYACTAGQGSSCGGSLG